MNLPANWRTSLSGVGETVCLIVIGLCALPSEVWMNPKVYIPAGGLIIAKTFKDFLTKDKDVTGGTKMQDATGAVAIEGRQSLVDETLKATPTAKLTPDQQHIVRTL